MMWATVTSAMDVFGQWTKQLEALLAIYIYIFVYVYVYTHTHIDIIYHDEDHIDSSVSKVIDLSQILGTHMVEEEN